MPTIISAHQGCLLVFPSNRGFWFGLQKAILAHLAKSSCLDSWPSCIYDVQRHSASTFERIYIFFVWESRIGEHDWHTNEASRISGSIAYWNANPQSRAICAFKLINLARAADQKHTPFLCVDFLDVSFSLTSLWPSICFHSLLTQISISNPFLAILAFFLSALADIALLW